MIINKQSLTLVLTASAAFAMGCGGPAATNSGTNSNAVMKSNAANATANPANSAGTSTSVSKSADPAESPSAAYRAAYEARKTKNLPGLKMLISKEASRILTEMGQADPKNKQTLDDMLKELFEEPQAPTADTRNEQINGDKASVEYLDEKGDWQKMDFIKEDGIWKLTIEKPQIGVGDPGSKP